MKPYDPSETGAQYIDRLEAEVSRLTTENDTFRRLLSECAEVLDDEGYEGAARRVREATATAPLSDAER